MSAQLQGIRSRAKALVDAEIDNPTEQDYKLARQAIIIGMSMEIDNQMGIFANSNKSNDLTSEKRPFDSNDLK